MAKGSENMILIENNLYKTKSEKMNLRNRITLAWDESEYRRHYKPPFPIEYSKEGGVL